jgi:protein tyrosine kinase modulator
MTMLQRQAFQENRPDEDSGQSLSLMNLLEILKRRAVLFAVPFFIIFAIGCLIAAVWPARYLSQGKILVSSQEIPTDLVRPTVATLANERMQIIEQRVMTRDNLLAVAKKFQLTAGWQGLLTGSDIVDFIRDRAQFKPLELNLQGDRKTAIAFTIGFEYEQPQIAVKVANEFVTMVLNEDVRSRTNFASETTKFLEEEVKRVESAINSVDAQYLELRNRNAGLADLAQTSQSDDARQIAALRAELLTKSAIYSDTHPDILALKKKIEAFQKPTLLGELTADATQKADTTPKTDASQKVDATQKTAAPKSGKGDATQKSDPTASTDLSGIDALANKRQNLISDLTSARQKLTAARLGESLERGQHSERLEVIEQATLPKKPTSPNRPKIVGIAFVIAMMASGGLVFASESLNPAIRHTSDLFSVVDSHLIVSIPYISKLGEVRRRKKMIILTTGILVALVAAGLTVSYFILPPFDILFAKIMTALFQ